MNFVRLIFLFLAISPVHLIGQEQDGGDQDDKMNFYNKYFNFTEFDFVGTGSLIDAINNPENIAAGLNPSGTIGVTMASERTSLQLFFSVGEADVVNIQDFRNFGSAIAFPSLSGNSFGTLGRFEIGDGLFGSPATCGVIFDLRVSRNNWNIGSDSLISASPGVFRFGFFIRPFKFEDKHNACVELSGTFVNRVIGGDFNTEERKIDGDVVTGRAYNGIDFALTFKYKAFEIYARVAGTNTFRVIPGLSGNQFSVGLNFIAPLSGNSDTTELSGFTL